MRKVLYLMVVLSMLLVSNSWAQERAVSGTVTASDGSAVPGVNVILKGTTTGTVTDINGSYKLTVPEDGATLLFSFIGFKTQEMVVGSQSVIDIGMESDVTELSEVIVTALGISRDEKSLGYAVQQVDGDDVNQGRETNITNALSGIAAGVQINQSQTMGGSTNILIRGVNSLTGNNQAMFVVDGVPIDNTVNNSSSVATARGGYDYGNLAMDINPDDIESVTVLKGASAAALYGNRAANGVILITTKKGKNQPGIGLTWNSNVTVTNVNKATMPTHQKEYGAGYGPYYTGPGDYWIEEDVDGDGNLDLVVPTMDDASWGAPLDGTMAVHWDAMDPLASNFGQKRAYLPPEVGFQDGWFESGVQFNNNLSFMGGNDKTTFRFSFSNITETGVMPNSEMDRNKLSFNGTQALTDKFTIETSVNYVKNEALGRAGNGYDGLNVMQSFGQWFEAQLDFDRLKNYKNEFGQHQTWNRKYYDNPFPIYFDNPYWVRHENYQNDDRSRVYGLVRLSYQLTPWLKASYRPAIDTYTDNQEERIAKQGNNVSDYTKRINTYTETNHEFLLTFNNEFSNEISLSGVLGGNLRDQNRRTTMNSTLGGLIIENLYTINNSVDAAIQKDDRVFNLEEQSVFFQASVGIKNQVFVDLTVRNDWSSTLPEENNSFMYPSASVSWVFSELLSTDVLSFGKLRASYAEVGNSTTPYRTSNYYAAQNNFGSTPLYSVDRTLNNPNLLPESQTSIELGFDVRFLQDRVGLDLAYYQVSTFDQILPVRTSEASGYNFKFINAGEIENKGVEIAITSTPVQMGDFRWDLNLNWAKNTNTVVSLSEDIDNYQLSSHFFVSINAAEGEAFGTFKGTDFVYHDNGQPIVESNGLYRMSDSNQEVLGGYLPKWNGGIINNFTYKNFRLTTLIDIQDGGEFYSESLAFGRATGLYEETAGNNAKGNPKRDAVADGGGVLYPGVQEDGSANTVYAEAGLWNRAWHYWKNPAATYVLDASYVKLRELTLTYTIPGSILSGTFIQGITVGFTGRNLAILHRNTVHSDPEANNSANNIQGLTSGDYPSQRQYGFNLRMSF